MTDDFEDAIRAAGRGLGSVGEQPTYAGAWQRGRRRRVMKRAAISAAGACALVAAFATDVGRFPGGTEIQVDDVAIESQGVPAPATAEFVPTSVPTTEPIPEPTSDSEPFAAAATDAVASATVIVPETPTVEPQVLPTTEPAAVATAVPTSVPAPTETPAAAPEPTSTTAPVVTPEPTSPAAATAEESTPEPGIADAPGSDPAVDPSVTRDPNAFVDTLPGPDEAGPAPQASQVAADARLAPDAVLTPGPQPCDTDGDAVPDARCELLASYPCKGEGDVRAGFLPIDSDEDGVADSCIADVVTFCDTTGDQLGDTPCRITVP